jgi:hypothetical protein
LRSRAIDPQCRVRGDPRSQQSVPQPIDNRGATDFSTPVPLHVPGVYLTDEVFLYRVVRSVASGVEHVVELEDCYGLDVVRVPASALQARGLRVVAARSSA